MSCIVFIWIERASRQLRVRELFVGCFVFFYPSSGSEQLQNLTKRLKIRSRDVLGEFLLNLVFFFVKFFPSVVRPCLECRPRFFLIDWYRLFCASSSSLLPSKCMTFNRRFISYVSVSSCFEETQATRWLLRNYDEVKKKKKKNATATGITVVVKDNKRKVGKKIVCFSFETECIVCSVEK